ncbi:hypothetical protein, variant [Aphanomyces astaci]|uniref:Dolichol kinase n=1 Tax=Aphanomyces astaci TaxID=112090 RepID=W4HBW2_APHAT|nr:hypothetical protein, variant [Aphanomyces astaci]ETV88593.1 hypothetical protein, variant [Aphanomyces astaci]|eukprot:XP_009820993.1 hypothetical protein, variant [Aphanomyces astaci]
MALTETVAMFTGPLLVIVGLVFFTPLGSLFSGTSSVAAVVFIVAILLLQFVVVRRPTHNTVRTTKELHVRRKIQHAGSGVLVVVGSFYANSLQVSVVLACSAVAFYIVAQLRKQNNIVNDTYLHVFGPILRQHEIAHRLPGAFWFLLGCSISLLIFKKDVAQLSVLHVRDLPSVILLGHTNDLVAIIGRPVRVILWPNAGPPHDQTGQR